MSNPAIALYSIDLSLGEGAARVHILRGVSLRIARGETVGVVGESGSGKTTLGRALLRLAEVDSGRILFDGQDITRLGEAAMRPLRRRMQLIFQDPMASLNPRHTIRRIVTEPMLFHGVARSASDAEARARALFAPPLQWAARWAEQLEPVGARLWPGLSGLILLEAVKQTFAAKPKGRRMPVRVFAPGAFQPAGVGKAPKTPAGA